jgi:hypothetical protein
MKTSFRMSVRPRDSSHKKLGVFMLYSYGHY